jgi:hypothetical protein
MGKENAESYGKRNAGKGELLIQERKKGEYTFTLARCVATSLAVNLSVPVALRTLQDIMAAA